MHLAFKLCAGFSVGFLTLATLIGFSDPRDEKDIFFRIDTRIRSVFVSSPRLSSVLNKRYSLTRVLLLVGFVLGLVSIVLS